LGYSFSFNLGFYFEEPQFITLPGSTLFCSSRSFSKPEHTLRKIRGMDAAIGMVTVIGESDQ